MKLDVLKEAVSEDRMENGAWLHLLTTDGDPMYLDPGPNTKPVRVLVRSTRSRIYRDKHDALINRYNSKMSRAKPREKDAITATEGKLERGRKLAVLVVSWENASRDAATQPGPTEDEALEMCEDSALQPFIDQIFDFAGNDENYGGAASVAAVGNGSGSATENA